MTTRSNRILVSLSALVFCAALFATTLSAQDLTNKNWKVYNINVSEPKLWDINHTAAKDAYNAGFTFSQVSTGWYTAYMSTNFGFLNGKTSITASASWTASTSYTNRASTPGDAHARIYFQSAEGNYTSSDYWWYGAVNCNLNTASTCTITAPLSNRAGWTNLCGQSATDVVPHPGANCVGGTDPAVSPYDGFTKALRNAKAGGLTFGGGSFYANGVAIDDAFTSLATFQLTTYRIN